MAFFVPILVKCAVLWDVNVVAGVVQWQAFHPSPPVVAVQRGVKIVEDFGQFEVAVCVCSPHSPFALAAWNSC